MEPGHAGDVAVLNDADAGLLERVRWMSEPEPDAWIDSKEVLRSLGRRSSSEKGCNAYRRWDVVASASQSSLWS